MEYRHNCVVPFGNKLEHEHIFNKLVDWCKENVVSGDFLDLRSYYNKEGVIYFFTDDAFALFKLRWHGDAITRIQ